MDEARVADGLQAVEDRRHELGNLLARKPLPLALDHHALERPRHPLGVFGVGCPVSVGEGHDVEKPVSGAVDVLDRHEVRRAEIVGGLAVADERTQFLLQHFRAVGGHELQRLEIPDGVRPAEPDFPEAPGADPPDQPVAVEGVARMYHQIFLLFGDGSAKN